MIPYTIDWAIGLTVAGTATALFNHQTILDRINTYRNRRAQHGRRANR